jgi:NADH:ubiquinone oxidoreductase subunit
MTMKHWIHSLQTLGLRGTARRLYQFRDIKFGTYVGSDEHGNKYFEDNSLPSGQNRWIEPKEFDVGSLQDASMVSPTWHGWLHYTTDRVPVTPAQGTGRSLTDAPADSAALAKDHYNREHQLPWRRNPTLARERGYGVDHHFAAAGQNKYYVQPGHMMHPERREQGPKIEAWDGAPTARGNNAEVKKEAWEVFFEQRKQMNAKSKSK